MNCFLHAWQILLSHSTCCLFHGRTICPHGQTLSHLFHLLSAWVADYFVRRVVWMLKGKLSHHFLVCPFVLYNQPFQVFGAFCLLAVFYRFNLAVIHHLKIDLLRLDCLRCCPAWSPFTLAEPKNSSTVSHLASHLICRHCQHLAYISTDYLAL